MLFLLVIAFLATLFAYFYYMNTKHYGMFEKHGIVEPPKSFPLGTHSNWQVMLGRQNFYNAVQPYYRKYKGHKAMGLFENNKPFIVTNDIELVKDVLLRHFDHFEDRRPCIVNPKSSQTNVFVTNFLFNLKGPRWRKIRSVMTPAFSSGKLKQMSPMIWRVCDELADCLGGHADNNREFNAKEVTTCYTLECITRCCFGIESKSFQDPYGVFMTQVDRLLGGSRGHPTFQLKFMVATLAPKIMKLLNLTIFDEQAVCFLIDVIKRCKQQRKELQAKGMVNMVDLVLEALEKEGKEEDGNGKAKPAEKEIPMDDTEFDKDAKITSTETYKMGVQEIEDLLVGNLVGLFFAGFDTTATTMAVNMGFLAKYPDCQEKLYQEIAEAYEKNGGQDLDYYTVHDLPYLDKFFHEVLRFYLSGTLERECTKDFKIPGTTFVIPKGMLVQIPVNAIQHDLKFYPDPDNFNPDVNWSPEAKAARSNYAFMGFGQGPRGCIGFRFALLQSKMGIAKMVGNYKLTEGSKMPKGKTYVMSPSNVFGMPTGSVWCNAERRNPAPAC